MPDMRIDLSDAIELTELLGFLIGWIDHDPVHLHASLLRFIGHPAYDTTALRTDLARFQFLLGGDEQNLFGPTDDDC
jgi:hypothetical protein